MTGPPMETLVLLRRVRDRMDRYYADPLDIPTLAPEVHLSAGYLSRHFKLAYGESPYSYLITRRIERAMALLRSEELSVTEICFAVVCQPLRTFSLRLSELVGVSPSEYRAHGAPVLPWTAPCIARAVIRHVRTREANVALRALNSRYGYHNTFKFPPL